MKYIKPIQEAIIDWQEQGIEEFREDVYSHRLPIFFEDLAEIGAQHNIEVVDYPTFYAELPDEHKSSAPPRGVPAFATVNPDTFRARVVVGVPRVDARLFDYIVHMLKHEQIHIGQWNRRAVHRAGPNPMDQAAYFSDKDEVMAFSHSIADQLIAMGLRDLDGVHKLLPKVRLYQDIRAAVDAKTLKRYHKYIYLYLEKELG